MTIEGTIPFPIWVDSTTLTAFRSCEKLWYWEHGRKLIIKGGNVHLHAGGAFAKGLETTRRAFYIDNMDAEEAIELGVAALISDYGYFSPDSDSAKTWDGMSGALVYYFDKWPLGQDPITPLIIEGQPTIEFSFAVPIPGTKHPVTGEPILLAGRSDMIGQYNGALFTVDEKTTKQLGQSWASQWNMRGQFMGYNWAARQHGHPITGTIVRGIAIRKTGYDSAEAIVYHSEELLDRWLLQTQKTIARMEEAWRSGYWHMDFGNACAHYGGCSMARLCESPNPENWVEMYYDTRDWNPLSKKV